MKLNFICPSTRLNNNKSEVNRTTRMHPTCNKQLLYAAEYDMNNYADLGGCYPSKPEAEVDNTLRGLHNSSYHTKAEFNNCFISQSKYFQNFEIIKTDVGFIKFINIMPGSQARNK